MDTTLRAARTAALLCTLPLLLSCSGQMHQTLAPTEVERLGEIDYPKVIRGTDPLPEEHVSALLQSITGDQQETWLHDLLVHEEQITQRPVYADNALQLLIDGPETYAAMLEAIDNATHHVHMETFIFADDTVGQRFADAMVAAAHRGVQVRLIYDGLANVGTDDEFFEQMRSDGVNVRKYHSPDPSEDLRLWRINNRNHRKMLIVDGTHVFTGGVNITSIYSSGSSSNPGPDHGLKHGWRDTHVRISGQVARSFQQLFLGNWNQSGEPEDLAAAFYQPESIQGVNLVRAIASEGGNGGEQEIYKIYLAAIKHAQEKLWITHAYFSPNEAMLDEIVAAAQRGVDVRLILPGFIDFGMIFHASRSNYDRLLSAGIRVFERNDALLHAKTAVVDGSWVTIGSANLDMRSFLHNDEVNATIFGSEFGQAMESLFESDAKQADELTLASWRKRPLMDKVKEFFSKRFNYWL